VGVLQFIFIDFYEYSFCTCMLIKTIDFSVECKI